MPGVNPPVLPASTSPEDLGDPDTTACAESGLEEVIGDLLVQEEEQEEQLWKRKLEVALRNAVWEVHCDLQAFGKRVDARLLEAAAQVVPLAAALAQLREENLRLRSQQEVLLRRVEALGRVTGAQELPLLRGLDRESSTSDPQDPQTRDPVPDPPPSRAQDFAVSPGRPHDAEDPDIPSTVVEEPSLLLQDLDPQKPQTWDPVPDHPLNKPQDDAAPPGCSYNAEDLDMSSIVVKEPSLLLHDLDPQNPQTGDRVPDHPLNRQQEDAEAPPAPDKPFTVTREPSLCLQDLNPQPPPSVDAVVPHPPTFSTRRSLSAPSLMANIPADDDMVLAAHC